MTYYDGTKLLSLTDINGEKPEIYIATTNRTGGKTTYFSRLLVNRFIDKKEKFCLLYRYSYELDDVADKFFKDINSLFFPKLTMHQKKRARGAFVELFLDGESCGYAVALNGAENVKKYSHFFSDVRRMFFDEFQSETNNYCTDEVKKLMSVHTSIARGQGKQTRYVPLYMCGNPVTILNPYYVALGISDKVRDNTKFLRGDGFVMEQGYVDSAANALKSSGFMRAFAGNAYVNYAAESVYLNDSKIFIEKMSGKSRYLATVACDGVNYAIREFGEQGVIYCDKNVDYTNPNKIAVTTADMRINYVMLRSVQMFVDSMRFYFSHGCFRFRDLQCKSVVLKLLSF